MPTRRYQLTIGGKVFEVEIVALRGEQARVLVNGRPYEVKFQTLGAEAAAPPLPPAATAAAPAPPPKPAPTSSPKAKPVAAAGLATVMAPMPGVILDVLVQVGDALKAGDTVAKLEAMKMENDVRVSTAGVVAEVRVAKGDNVAVRDVLLIVEEK